MSTSEHRGFDREGSVLKLKNVFTPEEAAKAGLTRRDLAEKVQKKEILRLAQGLYLDATAGLPPEHIDFIAAQHKFGKNALIGGLSAFFHHGLIDQPPQQIWVVVPPATRTTDRRYRLIRTKGTLDIGIEKHDLFRICDIDRAIIEAFRFSAKMGLQNAVAAAIRAIKEKKTTFPKIMAMARAMGYESAILKHGETLAGIMELIR